VSDTRTVAVSWAAIMGGVILIGIPLAYGIDHWRERRFYEQLYGPRRKGKDRRHRER
jgi:hypothetical protein